jgi:WD40 repeat protein
MKMKRFFLVVRLISVIVISINFLSLQAQNIETVVQAGHYASVEAVAWSHDGKLVATGSNDKTIILWRSSDGRQIRTLTGSSSGVSSIEFNKLDTSLLSITRDGKIYIWNIITEEIKKTFAIQDTSFICASFSPDGTRIVAGTEKYGITIWDIASGNKIQQLKAIPEDLVAQQNYEYEDIKSVEYSSDGKFIVAGAGDQTAIVWNAENGKEFAKLKHANSSCSGCLTKAFFTPDNKYVVSAYSDSIQIFDWKARKLILQMSNAEGSFDDLALSPDGRYASVIQYGRTEVWDINAGKHIFGTGSYESKNTSASFSPDGNYLVIGNEKRMAEIWRLSDGKKMVTLKGYLNQLDEKILNNSYMYWVALVHETKLSPDNKYIAIGNTGNNAKLIDFYTGRIHKTLKGHNGMVISLSFSNDGKFLVTGGVDGKAILWNVETGEVVKEFEFPDKALAIFSVDISPDNKLIATSDWAGEIVIWDIASGHVLKAMSPHGGNSSIHIKFSANGLYIISAGLDRKLKLIEIDTGEEVRTFTGNTDLVTSINLHPKEDKIITAGRDNTIRVWDFYSGLQTLKINAHQRGAYSARFDSTGKYIVSGGDDNMVKLWDAKTGTLIASFAGHQGAIGDAFLTNENKYIISGSRDGSIKVWSVDEKKELVSLVLMNENDWFVKTPEGYFDASDGAQSSISFVKGTELYSIDQFFNEFYRPGLYNEAVFGKTGFRGNIMNSIETSPPPGIEIISPEDNSSIDNGLATIMVRVTNTGGGVKELKIMHNGKRQEMDDSDLRRMRKAGQNDVKTFDLALVPGENEISISAFSNGDIESKPSTVKVFYKGLEKNANCYILSIGINKYENENLNLNYARPDAQAFADIMKKKGSKLFNNILIYKLFDKEATRVKVLSTLDEISSKIKKEDVFIFFYAGHGSNVENQFYFITSENTGLYQQDKLGSAISVKELQEKFKQISALKQVIFVDACQSGSSVNVLAMRGEPEEKALAQLSRSSGIHVMASTESEQQAAEIKSLEHGVFTYVLLEGLNGKADGAPKDSKVTVYELKSYIDDQVPEISYKLIRHKQFPSTFSIGHDFPLVVE